MNLPSKVVPLFPLPVRWLRGTARIAAERLPGTSTTRGPVAEEWIVLDDKSAEEYSQVDEHDALATLVFDLAALKSSDDAIAFTRRHGLLRHGPTSKPPRREKWSDWKRIADDFRLMLWLQLNHRDGAAGDPAAIAWMREVVEPPSDAKGLRDDAVVLRAAELLASLLSNGMSGAERGVGTDSGVAYTHDEGFVWTVEPLDLVQHAYVQTAIGLVRRVPARPCAECGQFFGPVDARQRFHSEACASRNRWRRWKGRSARGKTGKR